MRQLPASFIRMKTPARKRRYEVLDGLGPDGLPYRPRPARWRAVVLAGSALMAVGVALVYTVRPDPLAAITVFPPWIWLAPGLVLLLLGAIRTERRAIAWRPVAGILLLWLAVTAFVAEEPRSLLRTGPWPVDGWSLALQSGRGLRVASLNCAGGNPEAASEVADCRPDIVLLQEAPSQGYVEALARYLYGEQATVAWGADVAILAKGEVSLVPLPEPVRHYAARASVRLATGPEVEVVSLRLVPPIVSVNLLAPGTWSAQAENRRARRAQVRALVQSLESVPASTPLIVGGDFNAPGGDAAMRPLAGRLHDAFREGGRGWSNTIVQDAPVLRIDQVWTSDHFRAGAVVARPTKHSDHRLVVCDLWLNRYSPND